MQMILVYLIFMAVLIQVCTITKHQQTQKILVACLLFMGAPTVLLPDTCLFAAECITGPGEPYWLNDPCYAWVIDVDEYCCTNDWDNICQLTYDYCEGTWVGPMPKRIANLIMITDVLGRPAKINTNQLLFFIYDDGTVEKKIIKR